MKGWKLVIYYITQILGMGMPLNLKTSLFKNVYMAQAVDSVVINIVGILTSNNSDL